MFYFFKGGVHMNRLIIIAKHVAIALILTCCFYTTSFSKDKITWPYICFKPLYICQDSQVVDGAGFYILDLMKQSLSQYDHELLRMPVKRILESAKEGEKILFYGLYKTFERETFLEYSLPCRISTPKYIVIRKEDLQKFGGSKQVSLKRLFKDHTKVFLHLKSFSFGKGIDELLEKYKDAPNFLTEYDTTQIILKSLKLLLNKRADYMLSLDGTSYDARESGLSNKIAYLPIEEQNHYDVGYIVAPKNSWGKTVIAQVNEVLKKEIPKESFFQYFAPLVGNEMLPELRKKYETLILSPALK